MANKTQPQSTEPKVEKPQEIQVALENNRTGTVTTQGDVFSLNDGSLTRRFTFATLVNLARRGETPSWVKQVPDLLEKIETVFAEERSQGQDPHVRFALERGRITRLDFRSGMSLGASIADLRKLAQSGTLPRAFDTDAARRLISAA